MSTLIWPPVTDDALLAAQTETTQRELNWLLKSLQGTLTALKQGLEDCATLLTPDDTNISTLALSTHRAESLKGFITVSGARVVKGDIHLRIPSLPIPRGQATYKLSISPAPSAPTIAIEQITTVRTLINSCLDVVDATLWTGAADDANYMRGQLRLLHENVQDAKCALAGAGAGVAADVSRPWWESPVDKGAFEPRLPDALAVHLAVVEAAIVLHVRTLETVQSAPSRPASQGSTQSQHQHQHQHQGTHGHQRAVSRSGSATPGASHAAPLSYSGLGLRDRLVMALRGERASTHDEADETFTYLGRTVRVVDKVVVESQHPSLMAVMAKLAALDHTVALSRRGLDVLMNADEDDE